jgi:hypothetical protein
LNDLIKLTPKTGMAIINEFIYISYIYFCETQLNVLLSSRGVREIYNGALCGRVNERVRREEKIKYTHVWDVATIIFGVQVKSSTCQ